MDLQIQLKNVDAIETIKVIGEIDAYTAPQLKEQLLPLEKKERLQVEFDLSEVAYLDSTGLGVLVGFYKNMKMNNGQMKIVGLNRRVNRLFEITGLSEIIDIEKKESED